MEDLVAQVEVEPPADQKAELLPAVGLVLLQRAVGLQDHQKGLHGVFLRGRHDPLDAAAVLVDLLKKILLRVDDRLLLLTEKIRRGRPQALDQVKERDHRRRHLAPLQLRDKALGQLRPVRQFLLGEAVLVAQVPDPSSYIMIDIRCIHVFPPFFLFRHA